MRMRGVMNKHGHMTLSWHEDLFIIEVEGPFNEEGIAFWFAELKESVKNKNLTAWRRLEIWDEEVFASPKSMQVGESIYDWYENNGCTMAVIVVSNAMQAHILNKMKSNVKIFLDKEEAKKWLSNH